MSTPVLSPEELAYYASLKLADPDEAELDRFLSETCAFEGASRGTSDNDATGCSGGGGGSSAAGATATTPVVKHTRSESVVEPYGSSDDSSDGDAPQNRAPLSAHSRPPTSLLLPSAARRLQISIESAAPSLPGSATYHRFAKVFDKEDCIGGVPAMADAALQTHTVELPGRQLKSIESIQCFLNATHVYLQHNSLIDLEGMELLSHLQVLVVHHNLLTSLAPLKQLEDLFFLDATYNNLSCSLDALLSDELPCESIQYLQLVGNPCCWSSARVSTDDAEAGEARRMYVEKICKVCPNLESLDEMAVCNGEEVLESSAEADDDEEGQVEKSRDAAVGILSSALEEASDAYVAGSENCVEPATEGAHSRRVHSAIEAARSQGSTTQLMRSSSQPPSLVSPAGKADSGTGRTADRATALGASWEGEQSRLLHQLLTRRTATACSPTSTDAVDSAATAMPPGHSVERSLIESADSICLVGEDAGAARVSEARLGRTDCRDCQESLAEKFQLYQNIQYTQEVGQARLQRDVMAHWDGVSRIVQTAQALQLDRRRRLQERLKAGTEAYTESLELLAQESKISDLDRYRKKSRCVVGGVPAPEPAPEDAAPTAVATCEVGPRTSSTLSVSSTAAGATATPQDRKSATKTRERKGSSPKKVTASKFLPKPPPRR